MPSNASTLKNLIEGMGKPDVSPTSEFLIHLIDRMAVNLREAEQAGPERSKHYQGLAETYAAVYRAVRP